MAYSAAKENKLKAQRQGLLQGMQEPPQSLEPPPGGKHLIFTGLWILGQVTLQPNPFTPFTTNWAHTQNECLLLVAL